MDYIQHPRHGILPVSAITETQEKRGWKIIDINGFMKNKFIASTINNLNNMTRSQLIEYAKDTPVHVEQNMLKDLLLERLIKNERNKLNK